jgi:DMSO/TMAO reductase YedYZ molybdopterin-dependent catalytic subunit
MTVTTEPLQPRSWLDTRISRRRLAAVSALLGVGALIGYRLLGGFGGFRINTVEPGPPAFDPATYRFVVDGLVENPISLTYEQLLALPSVKQVSDFHCVEGWSVPNVRWEGVRLQTLLDMVRPKAEAAYLTFHALDGYYTDSLSLGQASLPDALIAYKMYDQPLTPDHGRPLRFIMPRMYGYKGAKFLYRMEFAATQAIGYWEQRGWQINGWLAGNQ